MDIYGYGYSPYQYNQSDELAKQMFAHQVLSSASPYNRVIPEGHPMPEPTGTPWNTQGLPWSLVAPPHLVQFTGQTQTIEPEFHPAIHCKRKNPDIESVIPAKQLITEEKMAAHLNGLHISSDYTKHSFTPQDVMDVGMETSATSFGEKLKGHRIVLSEEIKKLNNEPLLPASLIERLEKPCMSLMVWKPKESLVDKLDGSEETKSDCSDEEERSKRNGVLVTEPNMGIMGMDIEM